MSPSATIAIRRRVVEACHILYVQGQEHYSLGHVSARAEPGDDRFWIKPAGLGLGEVQPDDLVLVGLDGGVVAGAGPLHRELPIHGELYRARPDVRCIVHTHALYSAAFSASTARFRILGQDSVLFAGGFGWYDSPRLVVTVEQGRALAAALGRHRLVVLRNHGIVTADSSIERATLLAVAFDRSLRLQAVAERFGPVRDMTDDEVEAVSGEIAASQPGGAERLFEYLVRDARVAGVAAPLPRAATGRRASWD